nr:glycosyltransferase [Pseudopedobacter sp.]
MLISIITATYNSEKLLQSAIDSYQKQSCPDKELIIIDGKSTDATINIINKNQHIITRHQSQKDKGIYDALNKGIQLTKGEVIGILHSDDFYAHPQVLQKVAALFETDDSLMAVYGDLDYVDRKDSNKIIRHWESGEISQQAFEKGWMPPHPTLFLKKEVFEKYGHYDLSFTSAADYDLMLRVLYKYHIKTAYLPEVLVKMRVGGLSNQSLKNRWIANQEDRLAMKINGIPNPLLTGILKPLRKLHQFWS